MISQKTLNNVEELRHKGVNIINVRQLHKHNKQRIILTVLCSECGQRYDSQIDNIKAQKFLGLCTSCAHKRSSNYKRKSVDEIINIFKKEGYEVITPKDKIKPKGKRTIYFTSVEIRNKYGDIYTTSCNNFLSRINYYRELAHCDVKNEMLKNESRLEYKVRQFLQELNVQFKQEFRFMDCRGKKYPLPFDFCLYYTEDKKLLIEVDGEQHFKRSSKFANNFKIIQKNDKTKNYYCKVNNIPLLRLSYKDIDSKNEIYKQKIIDFIKNNRKI